MDSPSFITLIGLGIVAGVVPVYLGIGLALGTSRLVSREGEGFFVGIAIGVLAYLFFDLTHEAVELTGARDPVSWVVFLGSLFLGLVGLVALEQLQQNRHRPTSWQLSLPYWIALGMGLHNLGEGLSLGASYAQGAWDLSVLLVVCFALHNGTEGFGIIGAAGRTPISWKDAGLLGLIAGAPTCLGTVISGYDPSPYFTIVCYTLGAGSLLYVILALTAIAYTATRRLQVSLGIFAGIAAMFLTAMVLTLVGGVRS
jgi:zinc transporter, ZIP family